MLRKNLLNTCFGYFFAFALHLQESWLNVGFFAVILKDFVKYLLLRVCKITFIPPFKSRPPIYMLFLLLHHMCNLAIPRLNTEMFDNESRKFSFFLNSFFIKINFLFADSTVICKIYSINFNLIKI